MITYSIINKSKLEGKQRMDAEYYQPEYLETNRLIIGRKYVRLGEIITILTDYHANGSYKVLRQNVELLDEPDFALMVRTIDLENNNFYKDVKYISETAYNFLKKTKIFGGEIIINKIGSAGKVYLMPKLNKNVSLGMNQFMIRLNKSINTNYVYIFLVSKYGERIIYQRITGTVPLSIDKDSIRNIKVPILSKAFQNKIDELVKKSTKLKNNASFYYSQAESLLLEKLGLKDFKIEANLSFIVNLSDIKSAHRTDSEYFKPKYNKLIDYLKDKFEVKKIEELVTIQKGIEPGSKEYQEEGKPFIRVSNLSKFGIKDNNQKYLSDKLYQELRENYQPKVGEIILTKDASPGIAYVVKESIEGIISSGILRLKIKENLEPEYLALLINSPVGQYQMERDTGGSVIIHWRPDQVKNMYIPILSKSTQRKISNLVKESHEARKKAKQLLQKAKEKVEKMILNFKNG